MHYVFNIEYIELSKHFKLKKFMMIAKVYVLTFFNALFYYHKCSETF